MVRRGIQDAASSGALEQGGRMPKLILMNAAGVVQQVPITRPSTSLGRSPNSDLVLDTRRASRVHAVIEVEGTQVAITDLHSLNGTMVNGELIDRHLLEHGDSIEIGSVEMRYVTLEHQLSEDEALRLLTAPGLQVSYAEWDYSDMAEDGSQETQRSDV
jgi:pSer/pThr/pTyr-binding forkhead associated (FHA) protein